MCVRLSSFAGDWLETGCGPRGHLDRALQVPGEINAEQLGKTTLYPSNRAMLPVEVRQADVADEIFARLMGTW